MSTTEIPARAAAGFQADVDAYDRGRPEYAPEAVARLVAELGIGPGCRVLDLAAGTGKLTRRLVPTGASTVAVEPVEAMRSRLAANLPDIEILAGTAEAIPLPNHSVDAVVVGQAFHWFDGVRAVSEIRRVLRPGGGLGMIWQARYPTRQWIERLNEVVDRADDGNPRFHHGDWRSAFDLTALLEPLESAEYETVQRGTPDTIVDRVTSISYVAAKPATEREAIAAEVRAILADDPETSGRATIDLPYRAHVYWARAAPVPVEPATGVVLSVNTSHGGVPKRPIGSAVIGTLAVADDAHDEPVPMHGGPLKAVCLYPFEAIERVRAEGHQAFPGAYGENLTVAGLDWAGLRAGDRLRIGADGPVLALTEHATPCATQARWFTDGRYGRISHRSHPEDARWYAAVDREGSVSPGDHVSLVRTA